MELDRLTELAKEDPERKFFSIAHFLTPQALYEAFHSLRKDAGAGVDHVTYEDYEKQVRQNIQRLHERLKSKTYQALPLRRVYIPKEDGKSRPISIPALEDKILQKATVELLSAIYEQDFLDCSYGFRPGRGAQDALDEVGRVLCCEPTSCVLELDITSYFYSIVRGGKFTVHVNTMKKRLRRSLKGITEWCRTHRHYDVGWQQATLNAKLRGHYQYYGRPTNFRSLRKFYREVQRTWKKWLGRRTRGRPLTWEKYAQILHRHPLLQPRITRSWAKAA